MLSYQVREYYEYINKKLKEFEPNLELIIEFGNQYKETTTSILKKVISTNLVHKDSSGTHYIIREGGIQEQFKNLIKEFKSKFKFFDVFNEYAILKRDIEKYIQNAKVNDSSILNFFKNVDDFFKLYQTFMQSDNDMQLALDFGQSVKEISSAYNTIIKAYIEIENNMCDNENTIDNENIGKISIQLLNVEYDLDEFSDNLKLISEIYNEIGLIIYKGKTYNKIQIRKIESGSLLSIILGDKNIIESISIFLNKSVNLVFNKFTHEGKIVRHKEFREELMADVELTEKMKKLGYDVENAEKNNKEALTILTKDLLKLSSSSPKIKIDNNEYSIKETEHQKFIESSNKLLLPNGNKEIETPKN